MNSKIIKNARIQKEILDIIHLYNKIEMDRDENNDIILTLKQPSKPDEYFPSSIMFILSEYPFHVPKIYIYINNLDGTKKQIYINNLDGTKKQIDYITSIKHCMLPNITTLLKKYIHPYNGCLCCNNFISHKWSPVLHISHIIKDIQYINRVKQTVKYELALNRLQIFPTDVIRYILSFLSTL